MRTQELHVISEQEFSGLVSKDFSSFLPEYIEDVCTDDIFRSGGSLLFEKVDGTSPVGNSDPTGWTKNDALAGRNAVGSDAPAVSFRWLLNALVSLKRLPAGDYLVTGQDDDHMPVYPV